MFADLRRAWALFIDVRGRKGDALDLAGAVLGTAVLWAFACVFTLLEPLT